MQLVRLSHCVHKLKFPFVMWNRAARLSDRERLRCALLCKVDVVGKPMIREISRSAKDRETGLSALSVCWVHAIVDGLASP